MIDSLGNHSPLHRNTPLCFPDPRVRHNAPQLLPAVCEVVSSFILKPTTHGVNSVFFFLNGRVSNSPGWPWTKGGLELLIYIPLLPECQDTDPFSWPNSQSGDTGCTPWSEDGAAPLGCELGALLLGNRGFLIRSHSIPPSQLQPHYKMVTILLLIKEVTRYKCVHKLSAKSWCIVVNLEKKRIFFSMVLGVEPRLLSMASKYYHWAIQLNRGL